MCGIAGWISFSRASSASSKRWRRWPAGAGMRPAPGRTGLCRSWSETSGAAASHACASRGRSKRTPSPLVVQVVRVLDDVEADGVAFEGAVGEPGDLAQRDLAASEALGEILSRLARPADDDALEVTS
jgi:hypothetical protein